MEGWENGRSEESFKESFHLEGLHFLREKEERRKSLRLKENFKMLTNEERTSLNSLRQES